MNICRIIINDFPEREPPYNKVNRGPVAISLTASDCFSVFLNPMSLSVSIILVKYQSHTPTMLNLLFFNIPSFLTLCLEVKYNTRNVAFFNIPKQFIFDIIQSNAVYFIYCLSKLAIVFVVVVISNPTNTNLKTRIRNNA